MCSCVLVKLCFAGSRGHGLKKSWRSVGATAGLSGHTPQYGLDFPEESWEIIELSPSARLGTPLFSEVVPERAFQSWSWNSQQY